MLLVTTWYGTFVVDISGQDARAIDRILAENDPASIGADLDSIARGEVLPREAELAGKHAITAVLEPRVGSFGHILDDARTYPIPTNDECGLDLSLLIEANLIRAREKKDTGSDDSRVLSSIGALTEIENAFNLLQERIAEWTSKGWEEPGRHLAEKGVMASLAGSATYGEFLQSLKDENPRLAERMEATLEDPDGSIEGISAIARSCEDLSRTRAELEDYVDREMDAVAPNLKAVVGPIIGARLIHSAAGLQRLARLPSSTLQVLGAEKAFFRFLKEGGRPPKHGILFQHPAVHSARRDLRGRIARTIAAAAGRAARLDAFGGEGGAEIRAELDLRLQGILALPPRQRKGPGPRQPPFREGWWAEKGRKAPDRGPKRYHRR